METHPRSILELLTHLNPETTHPKLKSYTLSSNKAWYIPARILEWADFQDLKILKQSFKGRLYEEACRERQGLRCLPEIFDHEKIIRDEVHTTSLISRWAKAIVAAGQKPIRDEFHPLLWTKGDHPDAKNAMPPASPRKPNRVMPDREAKRAAKRQRTASGCCGRPDDGAISPSTDDSDTKSSRKERFPMEYKVASKWKSAYLAPLLDEDGAVKDGKRRHMHLRPIRQAFYYCVENMCRYGCIMTDKELFLFQVSALGGKPDNVEDLQGYMRKHGKMEYVSIPYRNHCRGHFEAFNTWTVNLAMWYMLIVGAQSHELGWSYQSFRDFPVGSTHCKRPLVTNGEAPKDSNETARQEMEAREDGEVGEDGGNVGAVSGPNDLDSIFGSDTSKGADAGSKGNGRVEPNPEIPTTKPKRRRRKTQKRKAKR